MENIAKWKTANVDRYTLLKVFAKQNRKFMTDAEVIFWDKVKGNSIGHKFLRQHIIGDYIVDFYCRDAMIVIEIDGGYHSERQQQNDDFIRQQWLESMGYKVVRFKNEELCSNIDSVICCIKKLIEERLNGNK